MGRPAGLQLPHFAHLLSEQGGHAGGGEHDAKSILGLRDRPARMERVRKLLSTATSLAIRRKTVNQKLIWVPRGVSRHWVQKIGIQGQCQGEGCIAETVALAPWLRDGKSRERW